MNQPPLSSNSGLSSTGRALSHAIHRLAWAAIDSILGVDSNEVLNNRPPESEASPVGQHLHRTARRLKSEAIRAEGRRVDYSSVSRSETYDDLRALAATLRTCSIDDLGQGNEKLAFWINLYNTLVIDGIISYEIADRVGVRLFRQAAYDVCGLRFSLDDIEHGVLRGNRPHPVFRIAAFAQGDERLKVAHDRLDPRIHFALVCGAKSCPPIAVYEGRQLDQQLDQAVASFVNGEWVHYKPQAGVLEVSPIFKWYQRDFGGVQQVRALIAKYSDDPAVQSAARDHRTRLGYLDYDWSVNALL